LEKRLGLLEKMLELLEHPATKTAVVASKPASERRRDSIARTCNSADITAPLTLSPPTGRPKTNDRFTIFAANG
jgi:hypothetical protein